MKRWFIRQLVKFIAPRLRFITGNYELWYFVESQGFHVTPVHFYQPIPDTRELRDNYPQRSDVKGIDWRLDEQLRLLRDEFPRYADEYNQLDTEFVSSDRFYMKNDQFVGIDPHVYYCMIRHFQPQQVVEVGAGFSTVVASQAALHNDNTQVIAIEPYPREFIKQQVNGIRHINQRVEELDLAFFETLKANDILFIDSSHVVKIGSDVCYLMLEILPRLAEGVIIHIHDIFLPFDYPRGWVLERRTFWNEQYLVQAYLMHNYRARILMANRLLTEDYQDDLKTTFPKAVQWGGGSLWFQI